MPVHSRSCGACGRLCLPPCPPSLTLTARHASRLARRSGRHRHYLRPSRSSGTVTGSGLGVVPLQSIATTIATWETEDQIPCGEVDFVGDYEEALAEEEEALAEELAEEEEEGQAEQ